MGLYFSLLYNLIKDKKNNNRTYWIPDIWVTSDKKIILEKEKDIVKVEPYSFFKSQFDEIIKDYKDGVDYNKSLTYINNLEYKKGYIIDKSIKREPGDWIINSNIYCFYIRSFTTFDHNNDGIIGSNYDDITINNEGVRETGTFLKTIALLNYIKELGFNTLYILPISVNGEVFKKGELGCPYSVKNPFKINPLFHDPLVNELNVYIEFKALVEAAHILGFRVILDFVFRIASRDSDFILEHPDWFYWIKKENSKNFRPMILPYNDIKKFIDDYEKNKKSYPTPSNEYIDLFYDPRKLKKIKFDNNVGYLAYDENNNELSVPGAFSDWPLDDIQPLWNDSTYLRYFLDEEFNYLYYDTIRFYDKKLKKENINLWEVLSNIIPFYQKEFGIDGARIDMSHAIPRKLILSIIENARKIDPDFCFISENFNSNEELKKIGFNITYGESLWVLPLLTKKDKNSRNYSVNFIKNMDKIKIPILGAPESLDSPRAASRRGGIKFSKTIWVLINTLPNIIPFCSSGFELGDNYPLNLGIDFTKEEVEAMSNKKLGFFDKVPLNWNSIFKDEMIEHIKKINKFRIENLEILKNNKNFIFLNALVDNFNNFEYYNPVIAYFRTFNEELVELINTNLYYDMIYPIEIKNTYLCIFNIDFEDEVITTIKIGFDSFFLDIFKKVEYKTVSKELNLLLKPGEFIIAKSMGL